MIFEGKVLPVVLATALGSGLLGAFLGKSFQGSEPAPAAATAPAPVQATAPAQVAVAPARVSPYPDAATAPEVVYAEAPAQAPARVVYVPAPARQSARAPRRVYYNQSAPRARAASTESPRRAYYEYKKPSFWQRHRDPLTVAIGAGTGTAIGAIAGGKKGAAIGAIAGGGGSALYTYLLRKRNR